MKALHVLADQSALPALAPYADSATAAGWFGGELIARDTMASLDGQGPAAADLLWFLVPHASDDAPAVTWSWRNAAVVAAFDVRDAQAVLDRTWTRIATPQPTPAGTPRAFAGNELCDLRFQYVPGGRSGRGMAFPFSIELDREG